MKNAFFILFLMLLPGYHYAQNCSANPGGDQDICFGETLTLNGEPSEFYADPLQVVWSSPTVPVQFEDANSLTTEVTLASGDPLSVGEYVFQLCVICDDGLEACQTMTVIVGAINNPPVLEPHATEICGGIIKLTATPPDPMVTGSWFIDPPFSGSAIANGNMLELEQSGFQPCSYEISYIHSVGGCEETASTTLNFTKEYEEITVEVQEPSSCPSCSNSIQLIGTQSGCGGTVQWTVNSAPPGVDFSSIAIGSPDYYITTITVPTNGTYCFDYTIENGDCLTGSATVCCEIDVQEGFGLSIDRYSAYCQDVWDIEKLFLDEQFLAGATYQWEVSESTIANHGITFSDPNANETMVNFTNAPMAIGPEGWFFVIKVRMSFLSCSDEKSYRFAVNPVIDIKAENINLLCGGNPFFNPLNNIVEPIAGNFQIVVTQSSSPALPVGSQVVENTTVNLTQEGQYCFDVTYLRAGFDPLTGNPVICTDEESYCVTVADVPPINCGSPIVTCLLTTELNGNSPTNSQGIPIDIPVRWVQFDGPPVTILNAESENPTITDMDYGNTYTFEYIISNTPDCQISCLNTITVLPEESCPSCDLDVVIGECINGCIPITLSGADTYTWTPSENVDVTDPENPLICDTEPGIYQVFGYLDGQLCGSAVVDVNASCFDLACEFTLQKDCGQCTCGELNGGATILDSNGNVLNDPEANVQISWSVDGGAFQPGASVYEEHYIDGPYVLCANVTFEQIGGMPCDTTMCVEVACHGDCPTVGFATCADPVFAGYSQCNDYNIDQVCNYEGWVWAVDAAGNPLGGEYLIDWFDDGVNYEVNPYYLSLFSVIDCQSIPVGIEDWEGECKDIALFEPDCCTGSSPEINCNNNGTISFVPQCGVSEYNFYFTCLGTNYQEVYTATEQETQFGIINIPSNLFCQYYTVYLQSTCVSGTVSNPSNCLFLDIYNGKCQRWEGECGSAGDGRKRSSAIKPSHTGDLIFPNPSLDGRFHIRLAPANYREAGDLSIELLDINGKSVQKNILPAGTYQQEFSTTLPSGVYLVNVRSASGVLMFTEKLIISNDQGGNRR